MARRRTLRVGRGVVPLSFRQACAARTIALSIVGFVRTVVLFGAALSYTPLPCRIRKL